MKTLVIHLTNIDMPRMFITEESVERFNGLVINDPDSDMDLETECLDFLYNDEGNFKVDSIDTSENYAKILESKDWDKVCVITEELQDMKYCNTCTDKNCRECEIPDIEPEECDYCVAMAEDDGVDYEFNVTYHTDHWRCDNCGKNL